MHKFAFNRNQHFHNTSNLNTPYSGALSSAYLLPPQEDFNDLIGYILTTEFQDEAQSPYYEFVILNTKKQTIFTYFLVDEIHQFEEMFLYALHQLNSSKFLELLNQHGIFVLSESSKSVESLLARTGLQNMQPHIASHLDQTVIQLLKQLGVELIPRVYNWITEVGGSAHQNRINALLAYPILLIPSVTPTIIDINPVSFTDVVQKKSDNSLVILNNRIDQGDEIESILASHKGLTIAEISKLRSKENYEFHYDIAANLYKKIDDEILVYEYLTNQKLRLVS